MEGKIILIEGTDCSGKQTQTNKLIEKLKEKYKISLFSFPDYDSPTGKIVGGPYLGKKSICDSFFKDGALNLDPKVAGHYFAADRLSKKDKIIQAKKAGKIVILDRYVESNMAHQGSKIKDKNKRIEFYNWCRKLEYDLNSLPKPDIVIFLHMPTDMAVSLRKNREELDEHEIDYDHLKNSEKAYLELMELYDFKKIKCFSNKTIKTIDEISEEIYDLVLKEIGDQFD